MSTTTVRGARASFQAQSPLRAELCRRVDAYFSEQGFDERGGARAALKSATIVAWAVASYVGLVFLADSLWTAAPLALSLGLALAGIGFSIMHDGGHGAASRRGWVNRLMAGSVDFIGGSSYFWHQTHDILQHTYTNIDGLDEDIDSAPFLRLAPTQRRRWYHRFQQWYEVPLLVLYAPKWALFDDWRTWASGRFPRPRGWDAVQLVAGKVWFLVWAIGLPLAFHPALHVALGFLAASATLGITLGVVFQLAHTVEGTEFFPSQTENHHFERPFFEHQIATTSNFAPGNRLVTWYVGGLNYQIEHHLFPRVGHRHYPAISEITREVCREFGVTYHCYPTVLDALRAHFRHLGRLGRASCQESSAATVGTRLASV